MKSAFILAANIILVLCLTLFLVDHIHYPDEAILIIRNIIFLLLILFLCYEIFAIYFLKKKKEETGLVYRGGRFTKIVLTNFYEYIKPFQKEFIRWFLVGIVLIFIGFVTLGIPGYLLLQIPVVLGWAEPIKGDSTWPSAIFVSLCWPCILPTGVLVKHYLIKKGYSKFALAGWIFFSLLGVAALITVVYASNG